MINDLKEIIAINSVEGEPFYNAPFGAGPRKALDWFLNKAASYGLKVGEDGGYCGWAEYGEGALSVGVLAHLDIVPAEGGWTTDPFTLTVTGGNIYGRGVMDDKGGAVAALHALKSLKDGNVKTGGRVRVIVGCNEESGCACMKHYAQHCEIPAVSFTPDADFPVINSEKGIAHLRIRFAPEKELMQSFETLRGGRRPNVVPAYAECKITGALAEKLNKRYGSAQRLAAANIDPEGVGYENIADGIIITAKGTAAHGSRPEKGDNAAAKLFSVLAKLTDSPAVNFVADYLAPKDADVRLNIAAEDSKSGKLTLNLGMVELTAGVLTATIDVRLPLSLSFDTLVSRISAALPYGAAIETLTRENNLYVSEDSPLINALLSVYEKHFGEGGKPLQIGGGTYAKTLPNCVAFGPALGGADYHIHDADEFIPAELFYKLVDVYRDAIIALCGLSK